MIPKNVETTGIDVCYHRSQARPRRQLLNAANVEFRGAPPMAERPLERRVSHLFAQHGRAYFQFRLSFLLEAAQSRK